MQLALGRLGNPNNNELLAELIKLGAQPGSNGKAMSENGALQNIFFLYLKAFQILIACFFLVFIFLCSSSPTAISM